MKKYLKILSILTVICVVVCSLSACANFYEKTYTPTDDKYFLFTLLEDETYSINIKDEYKISNSSTNNTLPEKIIFPKSHEGKVVTLIEAFSFSEQKNIISIKIPETITKIGNGAFLNCSSLNKVTIIGGVKEIGAFAFSYNTNLNLFDFNDELEIIGENAFSYSALTKSELNENCKIIGKEAFLNCKNLKNVYIGKNVNFIGENAFKNTNNVVYKISEENAVYNISNGEIVAK